MADSGASAGNIQNEPGGSHGAREEGSAKQKN